MNWISFPSFERLALPRLKGLGLGMFASGIIADNHVGMLTGMKVPHHMCSVLLWLGLQSRFRTQRGHFTLILNSYFRLKANLVWVLRQVLLKCWKINGNLSLFHALIINSNHGVIVNELFRVGKLVEGGYHHDFTLITFTIRCYCLISSFGRQLGVGEACSWLRVHPNLCIVSKYWVLLIVLRLILCICRLLKSLIISN